MAPQAATESWDDGELEGNIIFAPNRSTIQPSISSRHSIRSESDVGDRDWQLPLNVNDHQSTSQAISTATQAGIPLPKNIPPSALLGGSIKRLGKKNSRQNIEDDWDADLAFPSEPNKKLELKSPQRPPSQAGDHDDFDDFTDGSLGIRTAGTRRDGRNNRSSSVTAFSPSMGSCNTFESEEDGLAGLELPSGPMNLQEVLKKRKASEVSHSRQVSAQKDFSRNPPITPTESAHSQKDDFFADIEFGSGDVFDPKKRPVNRNIKAQFKSNQTSSPINKPQATLTFSERAAQTRLPRPISATKPSTSRLEPVFETGATNITRPRNSENLRAKRSAPALRSAANRLTKQPSVPSLPHPSSLAQPNYAKPTRAHPNARFGSDPERASSPISRPTIRPLSQHAPDTPTRPKRDASTSLAREAASKRTVTRPARRRQFGDGTELDMFDDLPTSATKEKQFMKQPAARQAGGSLRSTKSTRTLVPARDKAPTPAPAPPQTPRSPTKYDGLPRFARDTAASRIAREQTLGSTVPEKRPDSVLTNRTNWQAQVAARSPHGSPTAHRSRKNVKLINPPGKENTKLWQDEAARKGMQWNPHALRWEGNDAALHAFSPPPPPSPPRPALITNLAAPGAAGNATGIQVNGGMVFDPQRMCWLKMGRNRGNSVTSNPLSPSIADEDEEDPFAGIEDLKDDTMSGRPSASGPGMMGEIGLGADPGGLLPVHEEFDLGPEFIRRQREEENVWRQKTGQWFPEGTEVDWQTERRHEGDAWKWAIRQLALEADHMA